MEAFAFYFSEPTHIVNKEVNQSCSQECSAKIPTQKLIRLKDALVKEDAEHSEKSVI